MLVEPVGARANSWEDVADLSYRAGVTLDGWQELILRSAMGERSDSTWAAKRVGVSVPRQNGKSQLLVARALAGVLLFGELKIVVSAHQQDTARETFSMMVEILEADGNGWLMDRVRPNGIMNAINREAIRFKNGASIQFKARSGAGGHLVSAALAGFPFTVPVHLAVAVLMALTMYAYGRVYGRFHDLTARVIVTGKQIGRAHV